MVILWILILAINSFLLTFIYYKKEKIPFILLTSSIFFYAQIIGVFTLLGLLKLLYSTSITLSFLTITLLLSFFFFFKREKNFGFVIKNSTSFSWPPLYALPFFLVISAYFVSIYCRLSLPPLTTDGLLYHLPFAVEFFKSHNVGIKPLFFTDISMTYYPQGGTMLYLFVLHTGKEYLFKFTQLPFAFIGALSLYLISKEEKFPEITSISLFCIFTLLKPINKESFLCYVDLIMISTFLSALLCFYSRKKKYLPIGILSAALFITTKNFVPIYLIFILPLLFKKKEGKADNKLLFFSIFFFIFVGSFTYIRNLLLTGNPLFPAEVSLGNTLIFKGFFSYHKEPFIKSIKTIITLLSKPISDVDPSKHLSLLLFGSLIISLPLSIIKKDKKIFYLLLTTPLLIILYTFIIPPIYYQIRHLFPIYGLLSISLVYPFKYLKKLQFLPFLICGFYLLEAITLPVTIIYLLFSTFLFLPFILLFKKKKYLASFLTPLLILSLIFSWSLILTSDMYKNIKYEVWKMFYGERTEVWEFVHKNSLEGKNISYVGELDIYPFYGERYKNNLFYQSVNSIKTKPVHLYTNNQDRIYRSEMGNIYRKDPSFELWFAGLKEKKTDWIILKNDKFYPETEWIENNLHTFKKIFSNEFASVYETEF